MLQTGRGRPSTTALGMDIPGMDVKAGTTVHQIGWPSQYVHKLILYSPRFVPFGANLVQLGPKSVTPGYLESEVFLQLGPASDQQLPRLSVEQDQICGARGDKWGRSDFDSNWVRFAPNGTNLLTF